MPHEAIKVSHRDHPLRKIQNLVEGAVPGLLGIMHNYGLFNDTQIAKVLDRGDILHADDITLAGMQMTIAASRSLVKGGNLKSLGNLILGLEHSTPGVV